MPSPSLVYSTQYIYFTSTVDPTGTEPVVSGYGLPANWLFYWWNTTTNDIFYCVDPTGSPLVWEKEVNASNIAAILLAFGWKINTNRSYTTASITFGTGRTPNATNDTFVICNVTMAITLVQNCTITAQVDSGAGFVTRAQCSLNVAAASTVGSALSFWVPANAAYKLVSAGTGTNTIVSTHELTM
jgi:hypothetical protein